MDGIAVMQEQAPDVAMEAAGASVRVWERAEQVARTSYGRLLALLAAPAGDIELAEDSLADAFAQALRTWPEAGIPDNPEGWLLTVARHRQHDVFKAAAHRTSVRLADDTPGVAFVLPEIDPQTIPDKRLALLFVCAHPAIDAAVRAPLMLQTVLGFEAAHIARAFVIPPSTMAQRLVRAKRRIRDARIPFIIPDRRQMPERLTSVLEAIYGAYAIEWQVVAGVTMRESLAAEAHYLAVTIADLLDDEPEAFGVAALLSLSMARTRARGSADVYVPLDEQDTALWDADLIAMGEHYLHRAHALGRVGRFQLEAAIQSAHCARAVSRSTDWTALRKLYAALVSIAPTLGARVAYAATIGRTEGPHAALTALDAITDPAMQRFQPAWATRAHFLAEIGRMEDAKGAFDKAISLTTERALRIYLENRRSALPS